jgi:hypothetical protein
MEAIWRRLNDVNLKLPEELVVLMTLMGLPPYFETEGRILESRKDLSMEIIKKDLRQEALRLKDEQAQQPQGHLAVNLTREDSRRRKREKSGAALLKVCDNTHSSELLEQTWKSWPSAA